MRRLVKGLLARPWAWAASAPLRPRGLAVLMYHRVTRCGEPFHGVPLDSFRGQMRWLKRNCDVIGVNQFRAALRHPPRRRPAVLVTFDDGYRDYHDNAYPVLEELGIRPLVFLATSFMDTTRLIWTDAVSSALRRTSRGEIEFPWEPGVPHPLRERPALRRAEGLAKRFLKSVPDPDRRTWQAALFERLGVEPDDGALGRQMLSWDEVRATRAGTDYGAHTHTHPILSRLAPEAADEEIRLSRERIALELGEAPEHFAYPNGRAQDYTDANRESLRRHGFTLGFTTIEGLNGATTDPYAIRRQPTGAASVGDFAWLVAGR